MAQTIDSVLIQPKVEEIILGEDNSPGNALRIAQKYVEKYPDRIKLFQHPNSENIGAGASRNLGINNANGKYIAFLDADEYYFPEFFKNL